VIGRRALGFKEDMPENYERLLKDKAMNTRETH